MHSKIWKNDHVGFHEFVAIYRHISARSANDLAVDITSTVIIIENVPCLDGGIRRCENMNFHATPNILHSP